MKALPATVWRSLLSGLAVLVAVAAQPAGAQTPGPAEMVEWSLYAIGCEPPEAESVRCGDYGVFHFGSGSVSGCTADVSGRERPPTYSEPGSVAVQQQAPTTAATAFLGYAGNRPASPPEPPQPCPRGSCFSAPGGADGGGPWTAVIDWDSPHGWSTGEAVIQTSEMPAALYALDGGDLEPLLGTQVGDAHLLARVCELAEAVDVAGIAPPRVINMSFGRFLEPGDAENESCDASRLSCQIGAVLKHLYAAGSLPVAAAGNHAGQAPLYPAAYDGVLAVGSLDLARFATDQKVVGSWETPDGAAALMAGYGVCLEIATEGTDALWPAPAGASYASALHSGWVAHTLERHPVPDPLTTSWSLAWSDAEKCFALSRELPTSCNPAAEKILQRILDPAAHTCWDDTLQQPFVEIWPTRESTEQEVLGPVPSLSEWISEEYLPAPSSDPCVPCVSGGGFSQSLRIGATTNAAVEQLILDYSSSSPLAAGAYFEALYLRVEGQFHALLERSQPEDAAKLDALGAADAKSLVITGAGPLIEPHQQPSLVFIISPGSDPDDRLWTSIPILTQPGG